MNPDNIFQTPIDLIKTKLQIQVFARRLNPNQKPKYRNVMDCVRYTVTTHGIKAIWQGLTATMIRNIPANAVFFPVNELTKRELARHSNCSVSDLQLHHRLLAGFKILLRLYNFDSYIIILFYTYT